MKPNIVPMLQYNDVSAAIAFMVDALGFTRERSEAAPAGAIARAQLRFGAGAIDVNSASAAAGGASTSGRPGIHVVTAGGRAWTTHDPGGFFWSFGPDDMGAGEGEVTIVPELRYRDLGPASAWLHEHFGFEATFQVSGPDGAPAHVEMRLGEGTIFISPMSERGGFADVSQFVNPIVDDPDR